MKELRRRLERLEVPGEHEARERAWELVAAAYAQREPEQRPRRRVAPLLAFAAALAVLAAVLSPPGRAVLDTVRDRIAGVEGAEPALFELPAPGTLLADAPAGASSRSSRLRSSFTPPPSGRRGRAGGAS